MKSIFITLGRIVIILAVAALIVAGVSALTASTGDTSSMQQPPAFDGNLPVRLDHDEGGSSALGLVEFVKNIGVIGSIVTVYWIGQKWLAQIKQKSRLAL